MVPMSKVGAASKGATMVELFVWMAIAALVSIMIANFMLSGVAGMVAIRSHSHAQMQSVQALRAIYNDVRAAACVCDATFTCMPSPPAGTTLCLKVPGTKGGWPLPKAVDRILYTYYTNTAGIGLLRRQVIHESGTGCDRPPSDNNVATNLRGGTWFDPSVEGIVKATIFTQYDERMPTIDTNRFEFNAAVITAHLRNVEPADVFE